MEHTPFTLLLNEYFLQAFNQTTDKPGLIGLVALDRSFRYANMRTIVAKHMHEITVHCQVNRLPINNTDPTALTDRLMLLHHCIIDRIYTEGKDNPLSTLLLADTVFSWIADNDTVPLYHGWVDAVCTLMYNLLPDAAVNNCFWVRSIPQLVRNPSQDNIVACRVGIDWLSGQGNNDADDLSTLLVDVLDEVMYNMPS